MSSKKGTTFESRVAALLGKLVSAGLARDLRPQDRVQDFTGCTRKIDFTVILCTNLVEITVTIECKNKTRPLSLDDIDQIKTLKRELPERNVFWLVYEGSLNNNVQMALKDYGISVYSIDELDAIVNDRIDNQNILLKPSIGSYTGMMFHGMMTDVGSIPPSEKVLPYLDALKTDNPERAIVELLMKLRKNGGTMRDAEDILMELEGERGDDATQDLINRIQKDYVDPQDKRYDLVFDYEDLVKECESEAAPERSLAYLVESSTFWRHLANQHDIIELIRNGNGHRIIDAIDDYMARPECARRYIFSDDFDEAIRYAEPNHRMNGSGGLGVGPIR